MFALEHAVEQPDRDRAVSEDQPVLRWVSAANIKIELLVEGRGRLQVLHGQTDRECTECRWLFCHCRGKLRCDHRARLAKSCEVRLRRSRQSGAGRL